MLELAEVQRLDLSPFPWTKFKQQLDDLKKRRDWFAHGPWAYNANTKQYVLFVTSGKWTKSSNAPSRSRKIFPEGMTITVSDLRALRAEIETAIEQAMVLDRFVRISLQTREHASPRKQT
jgi:hypothetical protein